MTYNEMLKLMRENNVYGSQMYIAEELDFQLKMDETEVSQERFEELCGAAYHAYIKSDSLDMFYICKAVAKLEQEYTAKGENMLDQEGITRQIKEVAYTYY